MFKIGEKVILKRRGLFSGFVADYTLVDLILPLNKVFTITGISSPRGSLRLKEGIWWYPVEHFDKANSKIEALRKKLCSR